MKRGQAVALLALVLAMPCWLKAAENLAINPKLDYSDHNKSQGPLITGEHMEDGAEKGMPNYIFFYMEKCYNAKRQALITVHLYEKYKDRVHFVVVDLNKQPLSEPQKQLRQKYCFGLIPHETLLDKNGSAVFDYTGETDEATLDGWMDYLVRTSRGGGQQVQAANPPAEPTEPPTGRPGGRGRD